MTYLDIFAESISHFTNIDKNFIINHFEKYICTNDCDVKLVRNIMCKKVPENYAQTLMTRLKTGEFSDAINFFIQCFDLYRKEILRQSIMN